METGLAAIDSELGQVGKERPKREARPRKGFAAHIERIEEVIEPEIPDDCQGLEKVLIGEDRSERLDVIPPKFRVIVTRRPKYAFRERDGVLRALAPLHIIEGGLPSERLLAYIAVSKYADGLPLYRQEAIYLRDSVVLSRSLMAQWMGHLGFDLRILADCILERIKASERIFADETTLPTLAHSPAFTRINSDSHRALPTPATGSSSDGSTLTLHHVVEAVGLPKSDASVCRRHLRTTSPMVPVFSAAS